MRIDHVALYVRDLEAERDFYVRFFGAVAGPLYHNQKTGLSTYFLNFEGGARLEVMTRPGVADRAPEPFSRGLTHLSFGAGSRAGVDALTQALRAAGCEIVSPPRVTGDGYYESVVLDPEGNPIELCG